MAALPAPIIAIFSMSFADADFALHHLDSPGRGERHPPYRRHCTVGADEADALMFEAIRRLGDARWAGRRKRSVFVGRKTPVAWGEGAIHSWGQAQVLAEGADVVPPAAARSQA
jgi:hypothetical protein